MKQRSIEVFFGFFVIIIVFLFIIYGGYVILKAEISTYSIKATFNNIGTLAEGSNVTINGVKIGKVSDIAIDKNTYVIMVTMDITKEIKVSKDSQVIIQAAGFLDAPNIVIIPAKNNEYLASNGILWNSKDWISFEDKIGNIFLKSN